MLSRSFGAYLGRYVLFFLLSAGVGCAIAHFVGGATILALLASVNVYFVGIIAGICAVFAAAQRACQTNGQPPTSSNVDQTAISILTDAIAATLIELQLLRDHGRVVVWSGTGRQRVSILIDRLRDTLELSPVYVQNKAYVPDATYLGDADARD